MPLYLPANNGPRRRQMSFAGAAVQKDSDASLDK